MPTPKKPVMEKLTDADKKELVKLALDTAAELGLCDDTSNVLKAMGFDLQKKKTRIVFTVDVPFEVHDKFDPDDFNIHICSYQSADFDFGPGDEGLVSAVVVDE